MSKTNGAGAPPHLDTEDSYKGQKVIELVLDSGELVLVKPMSVYLRQAIAAKAETLYPFPDEADYERPVDPEKAAIPGMMHPAKDNPDYQLKLAEISTERLSWYTDYLIGTIIEWPAGKTALMAKYAEQVEQLAGVLDIQEDAWEATWKYCLVGDVDRQNIMQAVNGNLMLTEGEVRDAMRIFRPVVSGE